MGRIAVMTDTNSGISAATARDLGVFVLPMPIIIEGREYHEGVDLSPKLFYDALREKKEMSTSQPAPADLTCLWNQIFAEGYADIVYIPMSSGLSGSYASAAALAARFSSHIYVVDNHRVSVTQEHSVFDALAMVRLGVSAERIKQELELAAQDSIIYVGVETLEYLKKGGRITPAAAAMGSFLHIKPLLVLKEGKLDAYAKVRGTTACKKRLLQTLRNDADHLQKEGIPYCIGCAGSYDCADDARQWKRMVTEAFPEKSVSYQSLTFSIGTHVGPGAFGAGISRKRYYTAAYFQDK